MAYRFENASVLVVDDMKPMLMLTTSTLETFGFRNIYSAMDPDTGFDLFCAHKPDIVITDWLMQPYDGIELAQKIRKDPRSPNKFVPIILMTGYSAKVRVIEARDKGITEFLVKPFSARDLYVRIEQLIEKPRKFVDAKGFFGPDRRRKRQDDYNGPKRRGIDLSLGTHSEEETTKTIENILNKLKKDLKDNQII